MSDTVRSVIVISLLSVLLTWVCIGIKYAVVEIYRMYKHKKYKDMPSIIVDDGYGDIHRTIYPLELLVLKEWSMCVLGPDDANVQVAAYMRSQLERAKKIRNPSIKRRYELVTTLNIITIIRGGLK